MSIPESIPEDKEESFTCDQCPNGQVTKSKDGNYWDCDTCLFSVETSKKLNEGIGVNEL